MQGSKTSLLSRQLLGEIVSKYLKYLMLVKTSECAYGPLL